jgi:carbon monoxide dehydrogenase subunit G
VKVELEKTFPVAAAPELAWELLQDIEAVAGCMPGAKITERPGDARYKGTMTVKLGPATMSFRGDIEVRDVDAARRSLAIFAKGTDSTGSSGASMDLKARVEAADDGSARLVGVSAVSMSGKAASFGGRMMNSVAEQLMQQFAGNFSARAAALSAARTPPAPPTSGTGEGLASPEAMSATATASAAPPVMPPVQSELNALALAWAVFKDWLRGLFGRKSA